MTLTKQKIGYLLFYVGQSRLMCLVLICLTNLIQTPIFVSVKSERSAGVEAEQIRAERPGTESAALYGALQDGGCQGNQKEGEEEKEATNIL